MDQIVEKMFVVKQTQRELTSEVESQNFLFQSILNQPHLYIFSHILHTYLLLPAQEMRVLVH